MADIASESQLENETVISFEGDYVKVISNGVKRLKYSTELWKGVVETCREHDCRYILGVSYTTKPLRTMEAYKHADLFRELGMTHEYKIAWVESNPETIETTYFVETVLVNRGFTARIFDDEKNALEWLLDDGTE